MTQLWKAGIAAGGAGAGIVAVLAVSQATESLVLATLLGLAALLPAAGSAVLTLRPGTGVDAGPEWRVTALTIFLLTLAFGLMIGSARTFGGHGGHG